MHPVYVHLAMDWLKAEKKANPAEWEGRELDRGAMSVAIDRVVSVVTGQVAWPDASPGDRAVWKSRIVEMPQLEREWRTSGESVDEVLLNQVAQDNAPGWDPPSRLRARAAGQGPQLLGVRERLWWNFYDTCRIVSDNSTSMSMFPPSLEGPGSIRLFGNANIGNIWYTNLQIPGQMPGDSTFVLISMHVSLSSMEALNWAADNVMVQFTIGDRYSAPALFVRDLFRGVTLNDPGRRPLYIPVRQNYSAMVNIRRGKPDDVPDFDLTFHIEGLLTRDLY